jgi:hypothetical protein
MPVGTHPNLVMGAGSPIAVPRDTAGPLGLGGVNPAAVIRAIRSCREA